ncbi:MAG: hypothetical protein KC656_17580, partial [Myxococcales bacterium]|nr:hypothetical protein [Myxococcales bacterium]
LDLMREYIPVPEGYDDLSVYNCPDCYPELDSVMADFDPVVAAAAVDTRILEPLQAIDAMFDRTERITRLGSTVSPSEMTVDPSFTFNPDMDQDVSNIHEARLVYLCEEAETDDTWFTAPKNLVIGDTVIRIPSNQDLQASGLTEAQFLAGLLEPAASRIENVGPSGLPEVIYDGSVEIQQNIDRLADDADDIEGRGCNTAPGGGMLLGLAGLVPLAFRRRS